MELDQGVSQRIAVLRGRHLINRVVLKIRSNGEGECASLGRPSESDTGSANYLAVRTFYKPMHKSAIIISAYDF